MEFHVYENARAACEAAGVLIAAQITRKGDSVLGLATGSTPIPAYEMLAQWYDRGVIDFDRVRRPRGRAAPLPRAGRSGI